MLVVQQTREIKIDNVAITHLTMEIHFQTTDHVVAVEKVAEQHIGTKYYKCNSLRVISHVIILETDRKRKDIYRHLGNSTSQ